VADREKDLSFSSGTRSARVVTMPREAQNSRNILRESWENIFVGNLERI